jgi:hypothetical protein
MRPRIFSAEQERTVRFLKHQPGKRPHATPFQSIHLSPTAPTHAKESTTGPHLDVAPPHTLCEERRFFSQRGFGPQRFQDAFTPALNCVSRQVELRSHLAVAPGAKRRDTSIRTGDRKGIVLCCAARVLGTLPRRISVALLDVSRTFSSKCRAGRPSPGHQTNGCQSLLLLKAMVFEGFEDNGTSLSSFDRP